MKKIFLALTLSILTVITCQAQLTHTADFVKIPLPNGAYKMSKQQVDALPGRPKTLGALKINYTPPYNYQVGNVVLHLFNANQDSVNNDLPRTKRFEDELNSFAGKTGNSTYTSIIKNMDNKQVLIINYGIHNKG